jgi:hypothetical protein
MQDMFDSDCAYLWRTQVILTIQNSISTHFPTGINLDQIHQKLVDGEDEDEGPAMLFEIQSILTRVELYAGSSQAGSGLGGSAV